MDKTKKYHLLTEQIRALIEGETDVTAVMFVKQHSCIEHIEIISAKPEDTDFIAWIVAQGMHMDSIPTFLKRLGARDVPETTAGEYYFDSLAIVPEFRGRGLWRRLFDDAVEKARRAGFHRVTLICDEDYPRLSQLYTSYGFVAEQTFSYFDTLCRKMSLTI